MELKMLVIQWLRDGKGDDFHYHLILYSVINDNQNEQID